MLRWLIGIISGKIICESSNWQHIQRLKITILGANWQLFRLERIAKCSYFILSTQNFKFYWFVMKINLCCQLDDTIEVYFLLGINIWGLCSEWVKVLCNRPLECVQMCHTRSIKGKVKYTYSTLILVHRLDLIHTLHFPHICEFWPKC